MKKRILAVLLTTIITICILPAALGTEGSGFSDVSSADWFAPYVDVCVERGLMNGTGAGRFSPERPLSLRECSVLAVRLYDLARGGSGVFEKAPEDFGRITLAVGGELVFTGSIHDGAAVEGFYREGLTWKWERQFKLQGTYLSMSLTPEDWEWMQAHTDGASIATAAYNGTSYPGRMMGWLGGSWFFLPDDPEAFQSAIGQDRYFATEAGAWYRDAWYYANCQRENGDTPFYWFIDDRAIDGAGEATREEFAVEVAAVTDLPALNRVEALPDTDREDVLELYNAGVLNGLNGYGFFEPDKTLTRAEAAAMLARVLEPELRLRFTLEPFPEPGAVFPYEGYTLTYLMEPKESELIYGWVDYPLWPLQNFDTREMVGLLTLDGELLPWPEELAAWGEGVERLRDGDYLRLSYRRTSETGEWLEQTEGLMDREGRLVAPLGAYQQVKPTGDGHIVACKAGEDGREEWSILNGDGSLAFHLPQNPEGRKCYWWYFNEGLAPCLDEATQLYGYVDQAGEWVLPPQWEDAYGFVRGRALIAARGTIGAETHYWYGIIGREGEELYAPILRNVQELVADSPGYDGPALAKLSDSRFLDLSTGRELTAVIPSGPWRGYIPEAEFRNGYCTGLGRYFVQDGDGLRLVSRGFDQVGPLGPDGAGFVLLNGRVYRIQFEQQGAVRVQRDRK